VPRAGRLAGLRWRSLVRGLAVGAWLPAASAAHGLAPATANCQGARAWPRPQPGVATGRGRSGAGRGRCRGPRGLSVQWRLPAICPRT